MRERDEVGELILGQLAEIRSRGFALNDKETVIGLHRVAEAAATP